MTIQELIDDLSQYSDRNLPVVIRLDEGDFEVQQTYGDDEREKPSRKVMVIDFEHPDALSRAARDKKPGG